MWQTSRFECKYMIPWQKAAALRRWIQNFLPPDSYAATLPEFTYPIGSLYLDSPGLRLYRMTEGGEKNRFKLRVRAYSDDPETPVFFEIKRRIDRVISKSRVLLSRLDARDILLGRISPRMIAQNGDLHHLETYLNLMIGLSAQPVVRVRYLREAYESQNGDKLRLTFDHHLEYAHTSDFNFSIDEAVWHAVPMSGVLLEVKFTDMYPQWVGEMIRHFELQKIPFSKYNLSVHGMKSPLCRIQYALEGASDGLFLATPGNLRRQGDGPNS